MEFENLEQVEKSWLSGDFTYPPELYIQDIHYKFRHSSEDDFITYVKGQHPFVIYQTSIDHKEHAKEIGLNQWLVFMWNSEDSHIHPQKARAVSPQRFIHTIQHESENLDEQTQVIGDVVVLRIDLPSGAGAIKGKVDTGAEVCSLHADQMQISDGHVKFTNAELSENVITAPLVEKQAVKSSDGGVEYRPVVVFDVIINDKPVRKVQFNLNDRSEMEYKCLVGQNLLEKTGFMINPSQDEVPHGEMRENDEWVEDDVLNEATINFEELNKVFTETQE